MSNEQNFTKAKSLIHLIGKLHHSVIPKLLVINKSDWQDEKDHCLKTIKIEFSGQNVAVRSSAFSEDTRETSNAGAFKSILDIDPKHNTSVSSAIDEVFDSYGCNASDKDEVIIQRMVTNILFAGVAFTPELKNGELPLKPLSVADGGLVVEVTTVPEFLFIISEPLFDVVVEVLFLFLLFIDASALLLLDISTLFFNYLDVFSQKVKFLSL